MYLTLLEFLLQRYHFYPLFLQVIHEFIKVPWIYIFLDHATIIRLHEYLSRQIHEYYNTLIIKIMSKHFCIPVQAYVINHFHKFVSNYNVCTMENIIINWSFFDSWRILHEVGAFLFVTYNKSREG